MKPNRLTKWIKIIIIITIIIIPTIFLVKYMTTDPNIEVSGWITDGYDVSKRIEEIPSNDFKPGLGFNNLKVAVNEDAQGQNIEGFGASLTDSSAYLIHEVLSPLDYEYTINKLFNKTSGIGISYLRLPMGSSDCALTWYTYDDTAPDLSDFSISHDESYIIPLILDALNINPSLKIMATPFSAPGWMKTGNDLSDPSTKGLIGGHLNSNMYSLYADYFVAFIQAYNSHGIEIDAVTLQNEPYHSPNDYPGMLMDENEQIEFIKILGPKFAENNIDTKILILDHNWDLYQNAISVLEDVSANQYISGVAWHGYSTPNPSLQSHVHNKFPEKGQYFTEVTGFNAAPNFHDNLVWLYENIFIGSVRNWAKTALLWNLALNKTGGPILRDYFDMRGVITIDQSNGDVEYEVEYYAIGQTSKFVDAGAKRIHSISYKNVLYTVAYLNPDNTISLVISNPGIERVDFDVCWNWNYFSTSISPKSVITYTWNAL